MVLKQQVFGVHQVLDAEVLLRFLDAALCERGGARLFVDYVVAVGGKVLGVDLFLYLLDLSHLERADEIVRLTVKVGGFVAHAADDERRPRLVDEDGVDLVHYREIVPALNAVRLVRDHVVAKIVEAHLVVRAVGYVRGVRFLVRGGVALVYDQTDRQAEEAVDLAHPFRVAAGEVIVDRDDVHAVAGERVEVGGKRRDERFAFARLHLRDPALMQDDAALHLNGEVLHLEYAPRRLAAGRESLRQEVVERLAVREPLFELRRLRLELVVRKSRILLLKSQRRPDERLYPLYFPVGIIPEQI